ncbi:MAG: hypothetical protein DHS20C15_00450 [Planctomycetota bacterium]|nr:MAG: hypothetical protein DHS20C15_00450 [Planctomycetota bacterium]
MEGPGHDIWREVADVFERRCGRSARELWLATAQPHSFHRGLFTLDFDDASAKAAVDARYRDEIESIFQEITGSPVRLRTRAADLDTPLATPDAGNALPVEPSKRASERVESGLQGELLELESQNFARRALDAFVAGQDGFRFLVVHGPEGSGKTALATHALRRLEQQQRVHAPLVLSARALSLDVQQAARTKTFGELQARWGNHDLLVFDEAHRLRGQRTTQAVATSLIAPCLERGGRVLLLSRHAPTAIHDLGEGLRSHLANALDISLAVPTVPEREAVLASVSAQQPVLIESRVVAGLARRGPPSLGVAVTALCEAAGRASAEERSLEPRDLPLALARSSPAEDQLDRLIVLIEEQTGVEASRLRSAEKSRDVAALRHLCVHLAHRNLGLSARQICRSLGLRSPSVVAYARRAVERRRSLDAEFDALAKRLPEQLAGAQRDLRW